MRLAEDGKPIRVVGDSAVVDSDHGPGYLIARDDEEGLVSSRARSSERVAGRNNPLAQDQIISLFSYDRSP